MSKQSGFSIVDILVAAGVLSLVTASLLAAVTQGLSAKDVAGKRERAELLSQEGLEGARNIRNNAFSNLSDGVFGLTQSGGAWNLSGSSDATDIYTRQVIIAAVNANTKQVTSTVTWPQNKYGTGSVSHTTYLSNYLSPYSSSGAYVAYSDATTLPKYRAYDGATNMFGAESNTVVGATGRSFMLRTSPISSEAVAGYVSSTGVLQIMCFNGSVWTNEWSVTVGGTGTTRRFDIAYETNSGDVLVLYGTNTAAVNELAYRTKAGASGCGAANWTSATNITPLTTTGTVQWVKMAFDRRSSSNLITAIWADSNADLSGQVWSGTAWGNEPLTAMETSLEVVATAQDVDDFDVEYESLSGDVMVVWANSAGNNGTNGVRYRTCTGGTSACTWSAPTTPPTFADDATNLDISANPASDQIAFASIGNAGSDMQIGYWSGSAWTNTANVDTSCATPTAGSSKVVTAWLVAGGTSRSVVMYQDSGATNIGWYVGNAGVFTLQTDFTPTTPFGATQNWYAAETNPKDNSQLLLVLADSGNDVWAKQLSMTAAPAFTWSQPDGGTALGAALQQSTASPFGFGYFRN